MRSGQYESLLHSLFHATDYGILVTDIEGTDILCNPRFGVLFGMDIEKVIRLPRTEVRKSALDRVKDPAGFLAGLERAYADPWLEIADEVEIVTPKESILRRHSGPVLDAEGQVVGRFWTFLDVTETRRLQAEVATYARRLEEQLQQQAAELYSAQEKLLETAQMRAVGTLAISIAHDIRNILTTLRMEMAAIEPNPNPCMELAGKSWDRLYALTHCLLALSDENHVHAGPVDLSEIIEFVFKLMHGQAEVDGVSLFRHVQRHLPPVFGNPRRLEHLFVNLLLNALNAVASTGGSITVTIRREGARVRVDVQDTGTGISPEHQPHLFEPFFTTRANRTGLGLFSARRIVEAHQGEIKVTSKEGQGACVSVWLPVAEIAAQIQRVETDTVPQREAGIKSKEAMG